KTINSLVEPMTFSSEDFDRIVAETWVERVEYRNQVDSTSTWAMNDARGGAVGPCLYLTDRQTAGRGRGGAAWWSGEGGLTFALLTGELPIAGAQIPRLSLGVGVALCESLEPIAGQPVQLKWPNDIMVRGRKLAGLLIEVPGGGRPRLVIGIGSNVANRLEEAPEELRSKAISLAELADRPNPEGQGAADRLSVLIRVVKAVGEVLDQLGESGSDLADRWRQYSFLDGRQVEIELPGGHRIEGLAQSIDDEGALLVATETGEERCSSGTVASWGEAALGGAGPSWGGAASSVCRRAAG